MTEASRFRLGFTFENPRGERDVQMWLCLPVSPPLGQNSAIPEQSQDHALFRCAPTALHVLMCPTALLGPTDSFPLVTAPCCHPSFRSTAATWRGWHSFPTASRGCGCGRGCCNTSRCQASRWKAQVRIWMLAPCSTCTVWQHVLVPDITVEAICTGLLGLTQSRKKASCLFPYGKFSSQMEKTATSGNVNRKRELYSPSSQPSVPSSLSPIE